MALAGHEAFRRRDVIHPERHADAVFVSQLPRKTPADADIAEIVDDGAEKGTVQGLFRHTGGLGKGLAQCGAEAGGRQNNAAFGRRKLRPIRGPSV